MTVAKPAGNGASKPATPVLLPARDRGRHGNGHPEGDQGATATPAPTRGVDASQVQLLAKVRGFKNAAQIRSLGLYPYFRTISSAQDTEVIINGQKVLMLGSNSYLGLTNDRRIKEAV